MSTSDQPAGSAAQDQPQDQPGAIPPRHPLDPLTAGEFRQVAGVLRRDREVGPRWRIASIELREPAKDALAAGTGQAPPREALAVCWNRDDGHAYRAVVSLVRDAVTAWEPLPGQQPNITLDEWHECDEMLRDDPALAAALARRGITDRSRILTDLWAFGADLVPPRYRGLRLGWADVWHRGSEEGNPYAHHLSGLHPIVDLNAMTLLEVGDEADPGGQPQVMGEYLPKLIPMPLREVAPLEISQPDGVSFRLDGHLLRWQNWELRLGFNYREGLVLHTVGFNDAGPAAAGRAPAVVRGDGGALPGSDPRPLPADRVRHRRVGTRLHDHLARTRLRLPRRDHLPRRGGARLGGRAPAHPARHLHPRRGQRRAVEARGPRVRPRGPPRPAAGGVLPRHRGELRVPGLLALLPGRQHRVRGPRDRDHGHLQLSRPASSPPYGTLVDNRTYAPFHQHFIVARLDLDVDGRANTVYAVESEPAAAGPDDPYGLGLRLRQTPLRTEAEGQQDYDWAAQRSWKVVSTGTSNSLGTPTGYKLVPGGSFPALLDPSSAVLRRARVIEHTLWVTPYHPDERWPCGDFPTQSAADSGLPVWTAQNRSIAGTDVVLWYVFGIHHITRPEDWPIMPVDTVSFWLKPFGFFDRNPALDLPPDGNSGCHPGGDGAGSG